MNRVATGLDQLLQDPSLVRGRRWAMVSNHAAVTSGLEPGRLALSNICGPPVRLLAPEHGLDGVAQDMEPVADERDPLTGAPVRSLYGSDPATLEPTVQDLDRLDVVVVDLPDIGTRYYTYAATMDAVMAGCQAAAVECVVLDRPNPLGGVHREGGLVRPGFESFVGRIPVPVRHGLTLGELALLLQQDRYPELELTVVTCRGWRRSMDLDAAGLAWVAPSPNMPTLETAFLYPGLCLVEATTLSEGRGTTQPFKLVGAPWLDGSSLSARLGSLRPPGIGIRPARFRPAFGKHAGKICSGLELHVTDRVAFRPLAFGVVLLQLVRELKPRHFAWRREAYEFVAEVPAIDLLTGSPTARAVIEGDADLDPLLEGWRVEVAEFEERLQNIRLYCTE
ncbi:MAG: DUF1343 domain-containing protein [Acidobacteria bacterium]|nr:DUF1343 domain-containing protein [Acidobacteriota bacterium]